MTDNQSTLDILIRAQQQTQQAFEAARKDLAGLRQEGQQTNSMLGGLTKGLGALGIAFSATAVIGFAKDILDTAGNIKDLSQAMGISTDAVQDFKLAAEQSGATLDDVGRGIFNLNKGIGEGTITKALSAIGLEVGKIQAMSPEDRFRAVAAALSNVTDQAERDALGQQLLGKAYLGLAASIQDGIDKTRDANKMSKDTIDTLDWLGDAILATGSKAKNFFGEALAKAINTPRDLIRDMNQDLERLGVSIETVAAKAAKVPDLFKGQGAAKPKSLGTEEEAQIVEALNKERKALDEASKAADQHAQKIKDLNDAIFGRTAIAAANDYVQALGKIDNITKVSPENQKKINATVLEAIEAYDRLGKTAPAALNEIYVRTASLPEATRGITNVIKDLGYEAEIALPKLYDLPKPVAITSEELELLGRKSSLTLKELIPEAAKKSTVSISDLAREISQLATIAGGSFGGVARDLGSIVSAASTATQSIKTMQEAAKSKDKLEGIIGMASGILGIVTAAVEAGKAIANLFDRNKGRDLIVDFADTFGGFDELHKQLDELGDEGEQLWIKLTQGVGRNNPQQAQAAIDAVTAALEKQKKKQGDAQDATEEGALATIETATQASEALKTVGEQLEANKGQWSDWSESVMGDIAAVARSLGAIVVPSPSGGGAVPGFAGGTGGAYVDFGAGTPVMLHGRERVMTEREGRQQAGGWGGAVIVQVDGREIARTNARYQRQVLAPYGVR
jgi:hypothetical protein